MRIALILLVLTCSRLFADGGVIVGRSEWGDLTATVFASPAPLRAGPVDFSVYLEQGNKPVRDAKVSLRWTGSGNGTAWLPPCCSMKTDPGAIPATPGHSGNRLLFGVMLPVSSSGPGHLDLQVERGGTIQHASFELTAGEAPPASQRYWPWLAMTPLAIAGFVLHQHIRKNSTNPARS